MGLRGHSNAPGGDASFVLPQAHDPVQANRLRTPSIARPCVRRTTQPALDGLALIHSEGHSPQRSGRAGDVADAEDLHGLFHDLGLGLQRAGRRSELLDHGRVLLGDRVQLTHRLIDLGQP